MSFFFPKEQDNPFVHQSLQEGDIGAGELFKTSMAAEWKRTSLGGASYRFIEQTLYEGLDDSAPISAEDATKKYGIPGQLSFSSPVKESVAQILQRRKHEEMRANEILATANSFGKSAAIFTGGIASNLFDPLTVAASAVPILGEARWAAMVSKFGPLRGRMLAGGIEGAVGNAAMEPLLLAQAANDQMEYGPLDSMINVLAGFGLGGGIGLAVGKYTQWNAKVKAKAHLDAIRTAINQLAEGKPVEVDPIIRASADAPEQGPKPTIVDIDTGPVDIPNPVDTNTAWHFTGVDGRYFVGEPGGPAKSLADLTDNGVYELTMSDPTGTVMDHTYEVRVILSNDESVTPTKIEYLSGPFKGKTMPINDKFLGDKTIYMMPKAASNLPKINVKDIEVGDTIAYTYYDPKTPSMHGSAMMLEIKSISDGAINALVVRTVGDGYKNVQVGFKEITIKVDYAGNLDHGNNIAFTPVAKNPNKPTKLSSTTEIEFQEDYTLVTSDGTFTVHAMQDPPPGQPGEPWVFEVLEGPARQGEFYYITDSFLDDLEKESPAYGLFKQPKTPDVEPKTGNNLSGDTSPTLGNPDDAALELLAQTRHSEALHNENLVDEGPQPTPSSHPIRRVKDRITGKIFYAKYPKDLEHARSEYISYMLYKMAGVELPDTRPIFDDNGFIGIASESLEESKLSQGTSFLEPIKGADHLVRYLTEFAANGQQTLVDDFFSSIMVDIWLGNRDFMAPGNLWVSDAGFFRIDYGAALKYRAQGALKQDWNTNVVELVSFFDTQYPIGKVLKDTDASMKVEEGISRIAQITDDEILSLAYTSGLSQKEAGELAATLIGRRDHILHAFKKKVPDNPRAAFLEAYSSKVANKIIKVAVGYAKSLQGKVKAALVSYKNIGYRQINDYLRDGTVPHYTNKSDLDAMRDALDNATSSFTFQTTTYLWRGKVPFSVFGAKSKSPEDVMEALLKSGGMVIQDKGYMSSSIYRDFAIGWNHNSPKHVVIRIQMPPGSTAGLPAQLHFNPKAAAAHHSAVPDGEYEFLLPRDTRLVPTGAYRDMASGDTIVNVKAVPHSNIKPITAQQLISVAEKYKKAPSIGADDVGIPEEVTWSLKQSIQVEEGESVIQAINREADELLGQMGNSLPEQELKQIVEEHGTMVKQAEGMTKGAYAALPCVIKNANL